MMNNENKIDSKVIKHNRNYWRNTHARFNNLLLIMLISLWGNAFVMSLTNIHITYPYLIHNMFIIGLVIWLTMFGIHLWMEYWYYQILTNGKN